MADLYKLNAFTGRLDIAGQFKGARTSAPSTATNGDSYLNTSDDTLYMYYSGAWRVIITFTVSLSYFLQEDGTSFILLEDGTSKLALEA